MNNPLRHLISRWAVVVTAAFCLPSLVEAQTKAEYFIDADPGQGRATTVAQAIASDGTLQFDLPTAGLAPGEHLVGIRAYSTTTDDQGVPHTAFGPTITQRVIVKDEYQAQKILYAEYFWGDDPGFGHGTSIPLTPGQDLTMSNIQIPTDGLAPGEYNLSVRAYGSKGWGPTITQRVIVKDQYQAQQILYAEYFWGDDPGYGKGISIPLTPGQDLTMSNIQIPTDGLAAGEYNLSIRAYGSKGWGPTITQRVIVKGSHEAQQVLYAEYFWGDDPGFGKGSPILLTPGQQVDLSDIEIPTGEAHGSSILSIRAYGTRGWGPTLVTDILVDAEGNYTLNAQAETSLSDRNYQSLADLVGDFSDRGVGDDVTLTVVGTGTEYALDATSDDCLAQVEKITQSLASGSTSRDERLITFTAAEGSGNSLAITTTDAALPTVVSLFSRIATENVALTINGTAYNFTETAERHEELCAGETTTPVALGNISSAISASWEAQPHTGTTITGYDTSGSGDLPVMTLSNNGIACDSLTVSVTLSDASGRVLTTYDHLYIVHAQVDTQFFTTLSPANGSHVDPGTATLTWSAISDVTGYTVTVTPLADEEPAPAPTVIETDGTSCEITVESGVTYRWTVTAIGYCGELPSAEMTLTGRQLPDLTVGSITLPEAAQAGNALTVGATITNQGAGATTEGTWTDRLYYTVNSTNFDDAQLLAEVRHEGNIAAGSSYEVVFETTTPIADSGQLRVFVVTDSQEQVMESADDNNRTMSATAAELRPFYMNTDDLAALRKLHSDFGGDAWSGEPWDVSATIIKDGNWSGVTFDADGRVTAINLQGRGLSGALSAATAPTLPLLTTLNLSRNALTGDAAAFVSATQQPALTTLNLSYNQLDALSAPLPVSLTTLDLSSQHRTYGNDRLFAGLDGTAALPLDVAADMTVTLPAVATYNHARQAFDAHPQLSVRDRSNQTLATLTWSAAREAYTFASNGWKLTAGQDAEVVVIPVTSSGENGVSAVNSAFAAQLRFTAGDANLSGWTDVNDVQRTLNYVLDTNNSTTFGLWAANTYDDDSYAPTDETINIQDIVCTVNIVLDNESGATYNGESGDAMPAPRRAPAAAGSVAAWFYADGRRIVVEADEEVAAFSLRLQGVSASQVRLLLNARDWQMQTRDSGDGVSLVVFSPTGRVLPAGTTTLLRLSADAEPVSAQATDAQAEEVAAATGTPTRIAGIAPQHGIRVAAAEGRRLIVHADRAYGPTTVSVYSPSGMLLTREQLDMLPAGDTILRLNGTSDVVIVSVRNAETATSNHQIMTRP